MGFYGISTFVGYLNAESIFYVNNLFYLKTIQFIISTQFNCQKTFLFQTIQAVIFINSVKCKYSFNVEKQFYFK